MTKHATIKQTDGTKAAMCQAGYKKCMALVVWHRLQGDKKIFHNIFRMAREVDKNEGHSCNGCGTLLYALARDPEFIDLAKYGDKM